MDSENASEPDAGSRSGGSGSGGDQSPLSQAQLQELATAMERGQKIRGAAKVAAFTGWTVGAFGVLSLLFGLFSLQGILVGGALLAVAWNELEGRKLLLKFRPGGPRRVAQNQLWLLAVIAAYCLWAIYQVRNNPPADMAQLEELLELGQGFWAGLMTAVYGAVLLTVGVFQLAMYRYHAARIAMLEAYLEETPAWVVEIQRMMGG